MISQLTVFLENEKGRLAAACRAVSDAGINMHALNLADTSDFGVVRMLTDTPEAAAEALREQGYRATVTPVLAVRVPNVPGGLAKRQRRVRLLLLGERGLRRRRAQGRRFGRPGAEADRCRFRAGATGGHLPH